MRYWKCLAFICALSLLLSVPAIGETWSTENGDFSTKFWKEMFKGGGPGQPGNTLMALGDGFHFDKATLESTYFDEVQQRWITTYQDGELLLNSSGPWLENGKLKATNVTATNSSTFDPNTGELDFILTFSGYFDDEPGTYYEVEARYHGMPEMNDDFQRGYDFWARITINR